jgi:hypothetical protein
MNEFGKICDALRTIPGGIDQHTGWWLYQDRANPNRAMFCATLPRAFWRLGLTPSQAVMVAEAALTCDRVIGNGWELVAHQPPSKDTSSRVVVLPGRTPKGKRR